MLFNSHVFIFAFLPVVFLIYHVLTSFKLRQTSKLWLVGSSLFFYSWWNIVYLPLIIGSFVFNYLVGKWLGSQGLHRKKILTFGITINVLLLGFFKYTDFLIANKNAFTEANMQLLALTLPLAISFFTFQQIAYLVDAYRSEAKEYRFLDYALFVSFFPQLIAGPIVHHKEMMPQFMNEENLKVRWRNMSAGIFIFVIGLFKKVAIADNFAVWVNAGYSDTAALTLIDGWIVSLSYTFQLYFDFSGYTDMAIGIALLLNIRLPMNFNSPYKALNIKDFWKRWHMTLGRFLVKYIYIPMAGNQKGEVRTYVNIMIVFLISGIWHGAGWTFVFWGFLHGVASVIYRSWSKLNIAMPKILAWFITFQFINFSWVFFRADSFTDALHVLRAMVGMNGVYLPAILAVEYPTIVTVEQVKWYLFNDIESMYFAIGMFIVIPIVVFFTKNSVEKLQEFQPTFVRALLIGILFAISMLLMSSFSEFLYFNF